MTPKHISAVILAAGTASRMGRTKQLLPFLGAPLLQRIVSAVQRARFHERIVVLGHDAETIREKIDFSGIRIVLNPDYRKGQSTSLIRGLKSVSKDSEGAMFLLSDQPLISAPILDRLITAFENSDAPFIIPYCRDRRGNPVIAAKSVFPELMTLSQDTGARAVFREYENEILKIEIEDDAILLDIDTPDDYHRLLTLGP